MSNANRIGEILVGDYFGLRDGCCSGEIYREREVLL